mmetsp:Transcript_13074/g.35194  ORF Transcript_13074/g.35194 Transcript_13074/m.35194 type:complete len:133 (+) Transcript_13074:168-566(+)|eukprot:CAMPEP_0185829128 /NCGR_PEP_ID=MMETSP1353-20130828/62_1 /TAXON_ID=1077150 /ORGANISM="Erythrolobus australicus, Strain CCMP3124" /LENGTH=132 /DNA_ID=CAMNT_0028526881 /DNA_START=153 /DNA_END=551 /DNA_ORIENTATION=+
MEVLRLDSDMYDSVLRENTIHNKEMLAENTKMTRQKGSKNLQIEVCDNSDLKTSRVCWSPREVSVALIPSRHTVEYQLERMQHDLDAMQRDEELARQEASHPALARSKTSRARREFRWRWSAKSRQKRVKEA